MDSIDQHWVKLNEGAQAKATELGVTVDFMSPNTKDDAQQIEAVNNAVAKGYNAIMVAANGPDAISGALKEAQAAGITTTIVDEKIANSPYALLFHTNHAVNLENISLDQVFPDLLKKTPPEIKEKKGFWQKLFGG